MAPKTEETRAAELPRTVPMTNEDAMLEALNRASVNPKFTPQDALASATLPDACLKFIGSSVDPATDRVLPLRLSNGDIAPVIDDDAQARHYALFPLTDHTGAVNAEIAMWFPVSRDNHPELKDHEIDMRGYHRVGRQMLFWIPRGVYKSRQNKARQYFDTEVSSLKDTYAQEVDSALPRSHKRVYTDAPNVERKREDKDPSVLPG